MRLRYVVGILLLAGAAYFAVFGGEYSLVEVGRVKRELALEQERLVQARAELVRLQARVDSLQNDSATIVRIARERWGMIAPGERLYRFEEGDTSVNGPSNERERPGRDGAG
jgi:cell division protein FtsB